MHLFEPNPSNLDKLRTNLSGFESRITIHEDAVSDESGMLEFGIEETGRYGGLKSPIEKKIQVNCVHINVALSDIFKENEEIDLLKLDTEGSEIDTLNALSEEHLKRIINIYFEEGIEERLNLLSPTLLDSHQLSRKGNSYYLKRQGGRIS